MKQIAHFLKLAWKTNPAYIIVVIIKSLLTSSQLILNVVLMKFLVDELIGNRDVNALIWLGVWLIVVDAGITLLIRLMVRIEEPVKTRFLYEMLGELSKKIMNLEYSYLEDPYYLDLKESAVFAIHNQDSIARLVQEISNVITQFVTVVGLFAIVATLGWVLIAAFVISIGLSLVAVMHMMKSIVGIQKMIIPINRKMSYYLQLMQEKQYQKDVRLYDMADMIADRSIAFTSQCADEFDKTLKAQGTGNGITDTMALALSAFSFAWVGIRTLTTRFGPKISIGSLTMYVSSIANLSAAAMSLGKAVAMTMQFAQYLEPYLEFMGIEEETKESGKEPFVGPIETVSFKNVTFTYPKAEKAVLKNLTFDIRRGEKISIVGLNGAGKSTLVKLLCRMYKVDSGEIFVNGKNIYDYDYKSYMQELSAVFQDYKLFDFSIEENVSCQSENSKTSEVERLIDEVGLRDKIENLPKGIQSQFGKEYDEEGVEFSGGQGQKVAIARALYKESSMVILDEPASALDPIAEAEIYEKFNHLVEDKTAIYISHRMSSSIFCDKILIIDGGTVSDYDSHENLMNKKDSLYYKLFMAQADNYVLE